MLDRRFRSAVWADDNRPTERRRRRIRGDRRERLEAGARRIARLGAGECIECGKQLADRFEYRGASRKPARRLYCDDHAALLPHSERMHQQEMRDALEAATGQHRRRLNRRHGTTLS
jgi:hypothetical protein